jgi:DNA-binding winged helix-turn-helix (wHTH) protein/tetratricopeptide (TPR) repeat protein
MDALKTDSYNRASPSMAPFTIGDWLVEPELNTFRRGDRAIRVEPKVMEICVRLAEARGSVVSKAELLDSVWAGAIVEDDALTRVISELRRTLGDDARQPRFVETIPKRGYRLLVEVAPLLRSSPPARTRSNLKLAGGVLALVAIAGAFAFFRPRPQAIASSRPAATDPLWVLLLPVERTEGSAPLQSILEQELLKAPGLEIVPQSEISDVLALMRRPSSDVLTMTDALEIARRRGRVTALVSIRVEGGHDRRLLTVKVIDPADGRAIQTLTVPETTDAGVLDADHALGRDVCAVVRNQTSPNADPLPRVTTSSFNALTLFARGLELTTVPIAAPWPTGAQQLFRDALQADPSFTTARTWLALALWHAHRPIAEYRLEASRAVKEAQALPEQERLYNLGTDHALLDHPGESIALLESLVASPRPLLEFSARSTLVVQYADQGRTSDVDRQMFRLAELRPEDFSINAQAAMAIMRVDGRADRARTYLDRARRAMTPALIQLDGPCYEAAWIEHLPVFEAWQAGRLAEARERLQRLSAAIDLRVSMDRDAMATASGYFWLGLGDVAEARRVFEKVGDTDQREWNLGDLADLLDDRAAMAAHLNRVGFAYDPVPFSRAGLFERAARIRRMPAIGSNREPRRRFSLGEEALAAGHMSAALKHLQSAVDLFRVQPDNDFYAASQSLAVAWQKSGSTPQAIRVLQEAIESQPTYTDAGPPIIWWIKCQVQLAALYRKNGMPSEATALEARTRALLPDGDPEALLKSRPEERRPVTRRVTSSGRATP